MFSFQVQIYFVALNGTTKKHREQVMCCEATEHLSSHDSELLLLWFIAVSLVVCIAEADPYSRAGYSDLTDLRVQLSWEYRHVPNLKRRRKQDSKIRGQTEWLVIWSRTRICNQKKLVDDSQTPAGPTVTRDVLIVKLVAVERQFFQRADEMTDYE